jgi:hypothetical protein
LVEGDIYEYQEIALSFWLSPSNWEDLPLSHQGTNFMGISPKNFVSSPALPAASVAQAGTRVPWWLVNPILHGKNGRAKIEKA